MTHHTPSRLPTAFVRVSKCPICRYSLKDLANDAPCPECGTEIDRDLYTSVEMQNAVGAVRALCTFGLIAWFILGVGYGIISFVSLDVASYYFPGTITPSDYVAVGLKGSSVIAPIALACSWWRNARRLIYGHAASSMKGRVYVPLRIKVLNLLGVMLLFSICFWQVLMNAR